MKLLQGRVGGKRTGLHIYRTPNSNLPDYSTSSVSSQNTDVKFV